jgi:hypothetical protein
MNSCFAVNHLFSCISFVSKLCNNYTFISSLLQVWYSILWLQLHLHPDLSCNYRQSSLSPTWCSLCNPKVLGCFCKFETEISVRQGSSTKRGVLSLSLNENTLCRKIRCQFVLVFQRSVDSTPPCWCRLQLSPRSWRNLSNFLPGSKCRNPSRHCSPLQNLDALYR